MQIKITSKLFLTLELIERLNFISSLIDMKQNEIKQLYNI